MSLVTVSGLNDCGLYVDNRDLTFLEETENFSNLVEFSDVFIIPQYSSLESRKEADTSIEIRDLTIETPVISANMDTVTEAEMAIAMGNAGGIGALHRFMSIEENVRQYEEVKSQKLECFVSIGVSRDTKERAFALYEAGARYFIIDIAHGHSKAMKETILYLRDVFGDEVYIMAGNVATRKAVHDLVDWSADAIKIGIGPGEACLTKNVTGVTVPQFSAIANCTSANVDRDVLFVADGGIKEIGDIAKAIGAGADLVMCGRMFAGCDETPSELISGKKLYRGMASKDAMKKIRKNGSLLPTPEGKSMRVEYTGTTDEVVSHIRGGLQSTFSYCNARTIEEFKKQVKFGTRR